MNKIQEEPVRFWAAVTTIVQAVVALLIGFDMLGWTPEQVALVMALVTAAGGIVQFFYVRNRVEVTT